MEPSHKDAETAAAAAAVAAADPRGASSSSGVVVQVREKKGPLRAAIPYMPFPVAVICLFLNTFVPGLGGKTEARPQLPRDRGSQDRSQIPWSQDAAGHRDVRLGLRRAVRRPH
ncbi:protein stum homolog isoform X2 [Equus przewalskii]|uniref:Protein stum homolog isoform X2 n=1 Tax=Equus przewalskii TaxID=9798 RepID=A0ABM4N154_EQUPR|nr:protein stum homolog isoform X3 [Equus caballus]